MRADLTPTQEKVLKYWQDFQKENGNPPSLQGAFKPLDYASVGGLQNAITILVRKGFLRKEPVPGVSGRHVYRAVSDDVISREQ